MIDVRIQAWGMKTPGESDDGNVVLSENLQNKTNVEGNLSCSWWHAVDSFYLRFLGPTQGAYKIPVSSHLRNVIFMLKREAKCKW